MLGWLCRLNTIVIVLAVVACLSTGCADTASPPDASVDVSSNTVGLLFAPDSGGWTIAPFRQAKPGDEFYSGGRLYRATASTKANPVLSMSASKLTEADLPFCKSSRPPKSDDAVQILSDDMRFIAHSELAAVKPGSLLRFQGKAYKIAADRKLTDTGITFSENTTQLRAIEITDRGMRHVMDRHSVGGASTAGKSIFSAGENIRALILDAQLATPVLQQNGYLKRVMDAGRIIGIDRYRGTRTSTYWVITTQTAKLVTAYPAAD